MRARPGSRTRRVNWRKLPPRQNLNIASRSRFSGCSLQKTRSSHAAGLGACSSKIMRRLVYLFLGLAAFSAPAGQLPLTVSEIGLMLRAGYSSQTLMQELANRHLADTLDDAKEQALVKAGASSELIASIKSGAYSLSADKTAAVLQQMEAQAQHQAEAAVAARKSQAAYE